MDEKTSGFFDDDGMPLNPDIMPKPGLCTTCRHDNDSKQEALCLLSRMDQQGKLDFKCDAYEKDGEYA